ncbi:MAG: acetate/propionate family kinase [Burkholderiaceae bacterium]
MGTILVFNAGSSSIKFSILEQKTSVGVLHPKVKGHVAQVGAKVELLVKDAKGIELALVAKASPSDRFDHDAAITQLLAWFDEQAEAWTFDAIGHRVVHGGQIYSAPIRISDAVLRDLDALVPLAPLHQPHSLKVIRALRARWPGIAQVACFDTAFHTTQSVISQAYALPRAMTDKGVRRYGFHGLSYEYIATRLPRVLGERARGKVVVAHLGNGASLCGLVDGKSVASTMGFSALDGLVMGTRCGTLDPGVVLYLLQALHMSADEASDLLYKQSGLLGVSGISSDMHTLLGSTEPHAAQAIDLFVYRIVCEIGSMAAAMGGIDALVFTAGIGEHAAPIRERVCQACAWLGAALDVSANNGGHERLDLPSSKLQIAVIPTDEELMIALHTAHVAFVNHSRVFR